MIQRKIQKEVKDALARQAAVALIGPRQVGETTLALQLGDARQTVYLDRENAVARGNLADLFLKKCRVVKVYIESDTVPIKGWNCGFSVAQQSSDFYPYWRNHTIRSRWPVRYAKNRLALKYRQ